jgi:hypothetical protein
MKIHELKTDPELFDDVWLGKKKFEIRFNDRDFNVGDTLWLRKTQFTGEQMRVESFPLDYTGASILAEIGYILTGYGLQEGWCILGINVLALRKE